MHAVERPERDHARARLEPLETFDDLHASSTRTASAARRRTGRRRTRGLPAARQRSGPCSPCAAIARPCRSASASAGSSSRAGRWASASPHDMRHGPPRGSAATAVERPRPLDREVPDREPPQLGAVAAAAERLAEIACQRAHVRALRAVHVEHGAPVRGVVVDDVERVHVHVARRHLDGDARARQRVRPPPAHLDRGGRRRHLRDGARELGARAHERAGVGQRPVARLERPLRSPVSERTPSCTTAR